MSSITSTPSLSSDEYHSLLKEGVVFHELTEKTPSGTAFIQAIELSDSSTPNSSKEALDLLASTLKSAQNALKKIESKHCVRILKEFCSEIQKIQAKVLQSQASARRNNIKVIFNQHDLDFAKSMKMGKTVILTRFSPVSLKIKKLDAFCSHCKKAHASLKDFSFTSSESYLVVAGKITK